MAIKFNQYWDLEPGRKSEYADFVQQEFLPAMKQVGIRIVAGWVVLVGEGPHLISEGVARDIHHIDMIFESPAFRDMTTRHMRFVRNYTSSVLTASPRVATEFAHEPPEGTVKFNQSWNIRPGHEEAYAESLTEVLLPTFMELGIGIVAEWNVLIGSGPSILMEGQARSLEALGRALADPKYHRVMARWEELIEGYRSRILVPHQLFLGAIHEVFGAPIRQISEKEISSMYGPLVE